MCRNKKLRIDKNASVATAERRQTFCCAQLSSQQRSTHTCRAADAQRPAAAAAAAGKKMEQADLLAELSKAWQSVPYLSLALIVSAWTIGVFGLSILLDDCGDGESAADAITKLARRREFMKSHVV